MEWEILLSQVLAWLNNRRLSAKSHKAGISTLENTGVVVLLKIDPLDLGHVALHVDYLISAVQLVTNFVERLIHIIPKEITLVGTTANGSILGDFVPENVGLVFAIEAKIVLTLGSPEVARKDDRRLGFSVNIKVANLLVSTNLHALIVRI